MEPTVCGNIFGFHLPNASNSAGMNSKSGWSNVRASSSSRLAIVGRNSRSGAFIDMRIASVRTFGSGSENNTLIAALAAADWVAGTGPITSKVFGFG